MKKIFSIIIILFTLNNTCFAQKEGKEKDEEKENKNHIKVPTAVKTAFIKKYRAATKVTWEKEKGNYEANWGGKSGEDHSVMFTPSGIFVESVEAISISSLPKSIPVYISRNYNGAHIIEAGKLTDAAGNKMYDVEIKGKALLFDLNGKFLKKE
ncbi:MAG TPA: hypothetical protein VGP43_02415 [Chitinophagaceae bacterium]|nr:hypothetical protein [Chitinophagaceae bacterium]